MLFPAPVSPTKQTKEGILSPKTVEISLNRLVTSRLALNDLILTPNHFVLTGKFTSEVVGHSELALGINLFINFRISSSVFSCVVPLTWLWMSCPSQHLPHKIMSTLLVLLHWLHHQRLLVELHLPIQASTGSSFAVGYTESFGKSVGTASPDSTLGGLFDCWGRPKLKNTAGSKSVELFRLIRDGMEEKNADIVLRWGNCIGVCGLIVSTEHRGTDGMSWYHAAFNERSGRSPGWDSLSRYGYRVL